jgi:hypothetical protein
MGTEAHTCELPAFALSLGFTVSFGLTESIEA